MFEDLGELEHVFGMLDESCKYPPEDGLEWICGKTSLLIKHVNQLLQAVEKIEREHGVRAGTSHQSEILATLWGMLRDCGSSIDIKARLDDLKQLMLKAMVIGVDLKYDGLELLAATGERVKNGGKKGHEVTYGSAEEKAEKRALWQRWVDEVIADHPSWSFENIKKQVEKSHPGEVSLHQLKRYTKDTRK